MTPDELFSQVEQQFRTRKFSAGLLVAFIDFLTELGVPENPLTGWEAFLERFPRQATLPGGRQANTLVVSRGEDRTLGIRMAYNRVEDYFRSQERYDYPSCAPHATQAWADYTRWLDSLVTYDIEAISALRQRVVDFVLNSLPRQAIDLSSIRREPPLFQIFLQEFDFSYHRGEPSGAAYQGTVFGFLRADNPHLQVEVSKVRTGSRRIHGVGDVDAWDGARLAMSAEVKQFEITEGTGDFANFATFANNVSRRAALGLVVALEFGEGVRERIRELGLHPLSIRDIQAIVPLWDSLKQRTAIASVEYYCRHIERNSSLTARLVAFLDNVNREAGPQEY